VGIPGRQLNEFCVDEEHDVYLVRLADKLDVNLMNVAEHKIKLNAQKYPVDKSRGTSKKYTKL